MLLSRLRALRFGTLCLRRGRRPHLSLGLRLAYGRLAADLSLRLHLANRRFAFYLALRPGLANNRFTPRLSLWLNLAHGLLPFDHIALRLAASGHAASRLRPLPGVRVIAGTQLPEDGLAALGRVSCARFSAGFGAWLGLAT